MADAYVVQISDSVVASLNAASASAILSQTFTAYRAEVSVALLQDLDSLDVAVIPGNLVSAVWDLSRRLVFDWEVGVWIYQRTDFIPEQTDPLRLLTDQIITLFLGQQIGIAAGTARCIGAETRDLPSPMKLDPTHVFTT